MRGGGKEWRREGGRSELVEDGPKKKKRRVKKKKTICWFSMRQHSSFPHYGCICFACLLLPPRAAMSRVRTTVCSRSNLLWDFNVAQAYDTAARHIHRQPSTLLYC